MDLAGLTLEETQSFFHSLGQEKYRAAQAMRWIYQGLSVSFDPMTNFSKKLREQLSATARIGRLNTLQVFSSAFPESR